MNNNQVRIIGGRWRGQKINFLDYPGLRPTSDRVKETLFNWLNANIVGATCLDLFSGSGALGFEALSRGAKHVTFIDSSYPVIQTLKKNAERLNVTHADFLHGSIPKLVLDNSQLYDIVFVDPPFKKGFLNKSIHWLENHNYLNEDAIIYIERAVDDEDLTLPNHWHILKDKKAGNVNYFLIRRK